MRAIPLLMSGMALLLCWACQAMPTTAPGGAATASSSAPLCGAMAIDRDGDGYGVAAAGGPDADDADPAVNTYATAASRYPNLRDLLARRGYRPGKIFFIDGDHGNDSAGKPDDIAQPFASWDKVSKLVAPGDMAIFRPGSFPSRYALGCYNINGQAGKPIVLLAMPGEKVTIKAASECVSIKQSSHLVLDGFVLEGTPKGLGLTIYNSSNLTLRNLETRSAGLGLRAMQDLHHVLVETCVFHDSANSHGAYFGARDLPNSDIVVRDCLFYNNDKNGFQHNGRVSGLVLERCQFYSNGLAGISLLEGASQSLIRDNLIFNNGKQGMVIGVYDDKPGSGIQAYDQVDNRIENNLVWVGAKGPDGSDSPQDHAAIYFSDSTAARSARMSACMSGNVMITQRGPVLRFADERFARPCRIESNTLYGASGKLMQCDEKLYDQADFAAQPFAKDNTFTLPAFKDVKAEYFDRPARFDFSRPQPR